jgi:hypothetical protein
MTEKATIQSVFLAGRGWAQGYGGKLYGTKSGSTTKQRGALAEAIRGLCTTFYVDSLDKLSGRKCLVRRSDYATIQAIGCKGSWVSL